MLHHIVLIKPKESATERQLELLCSRAEMLKPIPGVLSVKAGKNLSTQHLGYSHFLYVVLENRKSLKEYYRHPNHEEFASRYFRPIKEDSKILDF